MTLSAGTKLGPYEILAPLGAGGMGEVYRARDSKLNREVALKVLPDAFARDADRMARFRREAQVLASLNHPSIAAIYGLEDSGERHALVMELVDGPPLADHIAQGPIVPDEALPLARQIAEGLEYAHESGIVHRDLKPANIKVTPHGAVKILDFGLAKAFTSQDSGTSANPSNLPTLTGAATQAGMILGTAAYMSPEQAKGRPVDRRADIWAFGCVLFEMLSGQKPFGGETISETLAAVLRADPEWKALPAATPSSVRNLVRRCLIKDPKQRLRDIGDARIAIEETLSGTEAGERPLDSQAHPQGVPVPIVRRALPWLIAAGLALITGIAAGWWANARRNPPSPNWSAQMLGGPSVARGPRISPDDHTLAFLAMVDGMTQVAVMDPGSGDWTSLTKDRSSGYITDLNWSPDGTKIYFDRYLSVPHGIYTVSRFGGEEHLLLEDAMAPEPLPDGSLIVIRVNTGRIYQLYRFWPESGRLQALDALTAGWGGSSTVRVFRDGKDAVFLGETLEQSKTDTSPHLYALDLASGEARRLAPQIDIRLPSSFNLYPIAVAGDDQSVIVETQAGDLYRAIAIPRRGTAPVRTLFSSTLGSDYIDEDRAGNLYLDQVERPIEVLRFAVTGATPGALVGPWSATNGQYQTLQLPDGRLVVGSVAAGRSRLMATKPGGDPAPFVQTNEETSLPACQFGDNELAFLLGPPGRMVLAVASLADGRIVRRLDAVPGNQVTDLAASPDGKTLYYVAAGSVWAADTKGGPPRRIAPGDAVAPDPNGKDLIVQLIAKEGVQLVRMPASGGTGTPILAEGPLRLAPVLISPNAVDRDGRVVASIAPSDSFFFGAAVLDPRNGKLERIPINFAGDIVSPGWLKDGSILTSGWPLKSTLWRFQPAAGGT